MLAISCGCFLDGLHDELLNPSAEDGCIVACGVGSNRRCIPGLTLEPHDRVNKRLHCGLIEEDAVQAVDHRLGSAAATIGNDWTTRGVHFERRHAEVLFARKQKSSGPPREVCDHLVGGVLSAKESVDFLRVKGKLVPTPVLQQLAAKTDGLTYRVCYCSVFDECWMFERDNTASSPKPIKTCPTPATPFQ